MSDPKKPPAPLEGAKVVSLFNRAPVIVTSKDESTATAAVPVSSKVDQKSVESLNSAIEAVLLGKCSGICIIGTGETGLARFWITAPSGKNVQIEAQKYLGQTKLLEGLLEEVVYHGLDGITR